MASLTQWTWVWASSRRWWGTRGLMSMGSQRVRYNWMTKHSTVIAQLTEALFILFSITFFTFCDLFWIVSMSAFYFFLFYFLTLQYCIGFAIYQNESATSIHVFPILNSPASSLPIPSLWVVPGHQPQASSIVHWTWTGDSFHIWYYTCFNAILPNHPTLSLSHRVQKTVLYICVSFAVSYTGLLLPSF